MSRERWEKETLQPTLDKGSERDGALLEAMCLHASALRNR